VTAVTAPTATRAELIDLLRRMREIRIFEDIVQDWFTRAVVRGSTHLYQGQEAVAVGVTSALRVGDTTTCTYRGHGTVLAQGAPLDRSFGEILGKAGGLCGGKGGSMHLTDLSIGALGSFAIVGAHLPISAGAGWAAQLLGTGAVSATFFGDGASNIGTFHEAANMAAILRLPVIFVCENNGYAEFTPQSKHMLLEDVAERAASYGMPSEICDGMDVVHVREATGRALERARTGGGPTLIEAKTYRYYDHQGVKGLRKTYRTQEEIDHWRERDAIESLQRAAVEAQLVTQEEFDTVWAEIQADAAAAIEFARESPMPDVKDFDLNVYSA
jgi:pyruvate dehydrogenase E1 component alpha subunit